MKEKFFDLVLVMLLVLVAFAVGLTLFGPSFRLGSIGSGFGLSRTNNDTSTPQVVTVDPPVATNPNVGANSETSSVSIILPTVDLPDNPGTENNNAETGTNENSESNVSENISTNNTDSTETVSETSVSTQAAAVIPLPEGSIDLQSIGFSYVTGGAGACGITLEAWKHIAVSRDILAKYPCGTKITIKIDKSINGNSSFTAIVGDTMNKKHTRTVNIYVAKNEPALEYGRQTGDLIP